jgi:two-component system response regulator MprA
VPELRRVLVVEDDDVIRSVLAELVELEGYDVRSAVDGREALTIVDSWRPDTIVLDLMMPRMDGWQFRDEQRKLPQVRDVPVIILSAGRHLPSRIATLEPAAIIEKPFDVDVIIQALKNVENQLQVR